MSCHRVPLVKKKSLRKNLIEHGLLKDFLKKHSFNPASKYFPNEDATLIAAQPLENYMDVSTGAGSRAAPMTGQGSGLAGGNLGLCSQDLRGTGKGRK